MTVTGRRVFKFIYFGNLIAQVVLISYLLISKQTIAKETYIVSGLSIVSTSLIFISLGLNKTRK